MEELFMQALAAILEESPLLAAFLVYWFRVERKQSTTIADIHQRVDSIEKLFIDFNGNFEKDREERRKREP